MTRTRSALREVDPKATVVLAGLAESRLGMTVADFLAGLYAVPRARSQFDAVALHVYARTSARAASGVQAVRQILDAHDDRGTPIWITEAGWATGGPSGPFRASRARQAELIRALVRRLRARATADRIGAGITHGRDGNVHFGDLRTGCVGMVSMLPDMMVVATGMAMAFKLRGEQRCALTWFGDGSTSRGDFHEAMNWAGVQKLPVIFVLENNQYAYSTPIDLQFAINPVERAAGYGFPGVSVDGNDAEAMFEATRAARERAIAGEGPTLIEARTMRMHGHGAHDDMKYVPKALVEEWRKKDPIDRQSARVKALGHDVDALRQEVKEQVEEATKIALAGPMPDPATATDRVFHPRDAEEILLQDGAAPWSGVRS